MHSAMNAPFGLPWGYAPHDGPALWGNLDPAFRACAVGREQLPIDLTGGRQADLTPVEFDYGRTRIVVEITGRTIQVNPDPGSGIVLDGVRYGLQQYHYHHGSEHTVDGAQLPPEMHFVHRDDGGALAVVGVLFEEGAAAPTSALTTPALSVLKGVQWPTDGQVRSPPPRWPAAGGSLSPRRPVSRRVGPARRRPRQGTSRSSPRATCPLCSTATA